MPAPHICRVRVADRCNKARRLASSCPPHQASKVQIWTSGSQQSGRGFQGGHSKQRRSAKDITHHACTRGGVSTTVPIPYAWTLPPLLPDSHATRPPPISSLSAHRATLPSLFPCWTQGHPSAPCPSQSCQIRRMAASVAGQGRGLQKLAMWERAKATEWPTGTISGIRGENSDHMACNISPESS